MSEHKYLTRALKKKLNIPDTELLQLDESFEEIVDDKTNIIKIVSSKETQTPTHKKKLFEDDSESEVETKNNNESEADTKDESKEFSKIKIFGAKPEKRAMRIYFESCKIGKFQNGWQNYNEDEDEDYEDDEDKGIDNDDCFYTEEEEKYLSKIKNSSKKKNKKKFKKIVEIEEKLKELNNEKTPYRFKLLLSKISLKNKKAILDKLEHYYSMDQGDSSYYKLKYWVENVKRLPFTNFNKTKIDVKDNPKVNDYIGNIYKKLESSVFGHYEAKNKILQTISKWISNPKSKGNVIALCGPMGNGKTTLVKKGIANAIQKPFSFIALGGAQDSSYLQGFDYTYEGAKPGRIAEILIENQCMDPIIYFDELDKLSETAKGQEISNLLCHITDPSQNDKFHDKYFSGIDIDLSKVLFIFSFNDESKINPILKDRITVIKMNGFNLNNKITIVKDYLLPELYKEYNFDKTQLIMDDSIIQYLINNYTEEKGLRQIKQKLDNIISKLNLMKITNIRNIHHFNKEKKPINIKFPVTLTIELVNEMLVKKSMTFNQKMMYL